MKPPWRPIRKTSILKSPITSQPYSSYFKASRMNLTLFLFEMDRVSEGKGWIHIPVMEQHCLEALARTVNKQPLLSEVSRYLNRYEETGHIEKI